MIWSFRDYVDLGGTNLIREWLDSDSVPLQAMLKIDSRILYLRGIKVWPEQYVSAHKSWDDLYELRVVFGGNQYRPLGCHGPGLREFTLVLGTVEKGKIPRHTLEMADERRKIILRDRSRSTEHVFRRKKPDSGEPQG